MPMPYFGEFEDTEDGRAWSWKQIDWVEEKGLMVGCKATTNLTESCGFDDIALRDVSGEVSCRGSYFKRSRETKTSSWIIFATAVHSTTRYWFAHTVQAARTYS